jgi:hypothetical protein
MSVRERRISTHFDDCQQINMLSKSKGETEMIAYEDKDSGDHHPAKFIF